MGKGGGGGGSDDCLWVQVSLCSQEIAVVAAQLCDYTKNHRILPFKCVNFMIGICQSKAPFPLS